MVGVAAHPLLALSGSVCSVSTTTCVANVTTRASTALSTSLRERMEPTASSESRFISEKSIAVLKLHVRIYTCTCICRSPTYYAHTYNVYTYMLVLYVSKFIFSPSVC